MKTLLAVTTALTLTTTLSMAESPIAYPPITFELVYGSAQPFAGNDDYSESTFAIQYDTTAFDNPTYFALDAAYSRTKDEGFGLLAFHYGKAWETVHLGAVGGLSVGEVNGAFAGLEWGYTGERFGIDIRGTHWRLDGVASNLNRLDVRAEYLIWNGISAFYDYTHQFATADGFKGDEFLYGINYAFGKGHEIELGMGNVHPQDTLTGASRVWKQFALTYRFDFHALSNSYFFEDRRIDPVDLPNFYDF